MAQEKQARTTYEIGGKSYQLRYSIGRLEQIEQMTGMSAVSMVLAIQGQKFPPISVVRQYFALGLIDGGGVYAPTRAALDFALSQVEQAGYLGMAMEILNALMEDCGFLFQST